MFVVPVKVRYRDLDTYNHVNSSVYFTYMEQARVEFFKENGLLTKYVLDDMIVVARAECAYKKPVTLDVDLKVGVGVVKTGKTSFDLVYKMFDEDVVYAVGQTRMVYLDGRTKRPKLLTEEFRKVLEGLKL